MDDYPNIISPFKNSGDVKTSFNDWWTQAKLHFKKVPDNVAEHWLYRHWDQSPYFWLKSKNYEFNLLNWESKDLEGIWSCCCENGIEECLEKGEDFVNNHDIWLVNYMVKNQDFPEPIIILDNRDDHISKDILKQTVPLSAQLIPAMYVLIEGHSRFDISLYLKNTNRFTQSTKVWLMKRI